MPHRAVVQDMRAVVVVFMAAALAVVALASVRVSQREETTPQLHGPFKQAMFAAGCFWGVEAAFAKVDGVVGTCVGFSGGHTDNPNYRRVSTGNTGHAESVLVTYDPSKVSYAELLDVFWNCHDPTVDHEQGPQRSIIFFRDAEQQSIARASLREVSNLRVFKGKIFTEILPAATFYPAEEDHQHYYQKHAITPVCHMGTKSIHTRLAAQAAQARLSASGQGGRAKVVASF